MTLSFFEALYEYWIWIGIPAILLALGALGLSIRGVITTIRAAHLFKVSLAERQELNFSAAGPVVLSAEGPLLSSRFARLSFALQGFDGDPIPGRPVLFRARSSGMSTARIELLTFEMPRPGRYILTVEGLGAPQPNDSRCAIVFMKPHLMQSIAYVICIVLAGSVFVVSLVFFLLRLREGEG